MTAVECRFYRGERPAADHRIADLGIQIAHIQWHVVPRSSDDPAPLAAVWSVPHAPLRLAPDARADRIAKLSSRLGR